MAGGSGDSSSSSSSSSGGSGGSGGSGADGTPPPCWVASGSEDHHVHVWDVNEPSQHTVLKGHTDVVVAVAAHPTENVLASGALEKDRTVKLWRAPTAGGSGGGEEDASTTKRRRR